MHSNYMEFTHAIGEKHNQPATAYEALYQLANNVVGAKLFTLTVIHKTRNEARRIYTNMPDAYPLQGTKPMVDDNWSRQVLGHHKTFVSNSIQEISKVFSDYKLIQSLGCEASMNIPIVVAGEVLGTLNCLHEAGHYSADRIRRSEDLKLPGALAFLINLNRSQGELP